MPTHENPLIPHARMRALYRGLVELRTLGERLPRTDRVPKGLEACWAGTAIDLHETDLTSDRAAQATPAFLRGIAVRTGTGAPKRAELQALLADRTKPFAGTPSDRLFCSIGVATALKASASEAIALAYVRDRELTAADWKRVLRVAAEGDLPLVIVTTGATETPASSRTTPVIPVDASDAVAIYRVAQETLLRARAEGGTAVIECVRTGADPVAVLAGQLLTKRIASSAWLAGVEARTRAALASL